MLPLLLWPDFEVAELFDLARISSFEDDCELASVLGVESDMAGMAYGRD